MIKIVIPEPISSISFPIDTIDTINITSTDTTDGKILLPQHYTPNEYDVICTFRGKQSRKHPGNIHFQSLINENVTAYGSAGGKLAKSRIVTDIVDNIRNHNGSFIKLIAGEWYDVGPYLSRERVSQSLRDKLSAQYRSSASSKKRRKNEIHSKMCHDMDAFVASNKYVSKRMRTLSGAIETHGAVLGDEEIGLLMNRVNTQILNALKQESASGMLAMCVSQWQNSKPTKEDCTLKV